MGILLYHLQLQIQHPEAENHNYEIGCGRYITHEMKVRTITPLMTRSRRCQFLPYPGMRVTKQLHSECAEMRLLVPLSLDVVHIEVKGVALFSPYLQLCNIVYMSSH